MKYRKKKNIIDFFNVSIVLPFFKQLDNFKKVFPKNAAYFQRNGIEIIIVINEHNYERNLIDFMANYPFINFKIIINREVGERNNLRKVINLGIKHASFDYILVMHSESEMSTDVIYKLRYIIYHYPFSYATGVVASISHNDDENCKSYGSIMVTKTDLIKINDDENKGKWGEEVEQITRKLDALGLTKMELADAKIINRESKSDDLKRTLKNGDLNNKISSQNSNEVIWDWKTHKNFSQLNKFIKAFHAYSIVNKRRCAQDHEIIALIQVRNESRNLVEILPHLDNYCDGIILLDDGSDDGSYKIAEHKKLLLKVQKKYKGYFDDLENRNDLLKLASFFKSKWFFFIDADERFDPRYSNVREYVNKEKSDVYRFKLVDLWDNPNTYRIDIPDRGENGIATRARMFKNKGSMQIYTNREIHFPAVPYSQNTQHTNILLLHYGNFDREIRERKYKLYKSQDPDEKKQAHSYDFLKDDKVVLKSIKDIKLNGL